MAKKVLQKALVTTAVAVTTTGVVAPIVYYSIKDQNSAKVRKQTHNTSQLINQLKQSITDQNQKIAILEGQRKELLDKIAQNQSNINSLKNIIKNLETYQNSLKESNNELQNKINALKKELSQALANSFFN